MSTLIHFCIMLKSNTKDSSMTKLSRERFDLNTAEMNRNNQTDWRKVVSKVVVNSLWVLNILNIDMYLKSSNILTKLHIFLSFTLEAAFKHPLKSSKRRTNILNASASATFSSTCVQKHDFQECLWNSSSLEMQQQLKFHCILVKGDDKSSGDIQPQRITVCWTIIPQCRQSSTVITKCASGDLVKRNHVKIQTQISHLDELCHRVSCQ